MANCDSVGADEGVRDEAGWKPKLWHSLLPRIDTWAVSTAIPDANVRGRDQEEPEQGCLGVSLFLPPGNSCLPLGDVSIVAVAELVMCGSVRGGEGL